MSKSHSDTIYRRRKKVLDRARAMARSGAHADHRSIIAELEVQEGFADARARFEEGAVRAQLDKLCVMARGPSSTHLDLTALRTGQRA